MELSQEQLIRYKRNYTLSEVGIDGQKKLLASKVLVVGAGAIGGAALMYLAGSGIGTIGISDYDTVELSNLHRQIIHRTDRIGKSKLYSAAETLREINPDTNIILIDEKMTEDSIFPAIADYDFVLDCTDRFESKLLINDACVHAGKPYCHAGVVRFGGQVMTYVPNRGPCLRCLLGEDCDTAETPLCAQMGVLGSVTGIIGSIQATEAIKYLLGIGDLLLGRILQIDGLTMRIRETKVPVNPSCRLCSGHSNAEQESCTTVL